MALTKNTTPASTAKKFEDVNDAPFDTGTETAVVEKSQLAAAAAAAAPAEAPAAAPAAQAAAAAETATTAIAVAQSSAVATANAAQRAKEFQKEVNAMRGACDFSFGNYEVYKANNGSIVQMGGSEVDLGRWAKLRLIGWDESFQMSPGNDDKSSKDFVAYSKDGKTVDSVIGEDQRSFVGKSVDEYVTYLRETEGFDKAKCRRFIDLAVALLGTDSGDGPIGTVIQLTLSESSIPAFSRYQQQLNDNARCVAMGLPGFTLPEDPFTFFAIRELASKNNNKWTKLKISSTLPNKI